MSRQRLIFAFLVLSTLVFFCVYILDFQRFVVSVGLISGVNRKGEAVQHKVNNTVNHSASDSRPWIVHLSVVACGSLLSEGLLPVKSALIFTRTTLHLHIFTDRGPEIEKQFASWPIFLTSRLLYTMHIIQYPHSVNEATWRGLFKPCASQRLFFPSILPDVDALIHVDSDVLFLSPVEDLWRHFSDFNSSQFAALVLEHEAKRAGWYNRRKEAKPFYGTNGVNSGVMLMNLTRMRQTNWVKQIVNYLKKYELPLGDQDLINVYFYFHPDRLYVMGCEWNFRNDFCNIGCAGLTDRGVRVLHGSRNHFENNENPLFKAIYKATDQYTPRADHDERALWSAIFSQVDRVKSRCPTLKTFINKELALHILLVLNTMKSNFAAKFGLFKASSPSSKKSLAADQSSL